MKATDVFALSKEVAKGKGEKLEERLAKTIDGLKKTDLDIADTFNKEVEEYSKETAAKAWLMGMGVSKSRAEEIVG